MPQTPLSRCVVCCVCFLLLHRRTSRRAPFRLQGAALLFAALLCASIPLLGEPGIPGYCLSSPTVHGMDEWWMEYFEGLPKQKSNSKRGQVLYCFGRGHWNIYHGRVGHPITCLLTALLAHPAAVTIGNTLLAAMTNDAPTIALLRRIAPLAAVSVTTQVRAPAVNTTRQTLARLNLLQACRTRRACVQHGASQLRCARGQLG